jgi:Putative transposase
VRPLRSPPRLVQLVCESTLSRLPIAGARCMDRGAPDRAARVRVFPRRLHDRAGDGCARLQNKAVVYGISFRATATTLRTIAADPRHLGALIGFWAVLHTWGSTLVHHPHLHCVVPGGGLSLDGTRWIACRPGFFLPVRVLSRLFRRLFLASVQEAFDAGQLRFDGPLAALADRRAFAGHLAAVRQVDWVVYAKRPFAGPQQVLDYVGRYTHRVAISTTGFSR